MPVAARPNVYDAMTNPLASTGNFTDVQMLPNGFVIVDSIKRIAVRSHSEAHRDSRILLSSTPKREVDAVATTEWHENVVVGDSLWAWVSASTSPNSLATGSLTMNASWGLPPIVSGTSSVGDIDDPLRRSVPLKQIEMHGVNIEIVETPRPSFLELHEGFNDSVPVRIVRQPGIQVNAVLKFRKLEPPVLLDHDEY